MSFEPFFLDHAGRCGGQRFCIHHPPAGGTPRSALLYVHPFAEEMNKSRRMAALQARALAAQGHEVLQIDLAGCGDSSGGFEEASWQDWIDDVLAGAAWLRQRSDAPLWLWGLRAGCLVAADAARRIDGEVGLLCWQPALSGKLLLQQFLRLRAVAEMIDGDAARGVTAGLRRSLADGLAVEVGGYLLPSALAAGLEAATLRPPPNAVRMACIELSTQADAVPTPALAAAALRWQADGVDVETAVVAGPAFWQTVEVETAPALIEATCGLLARSPVLQ